MDVWASKLFSIYSLTNLNTMVKQNPKSKYECLHCPKNHCKCCCKPFVAEEEKWDKEKADKDLENIKHRRQHIHSSSFPYPKEEDKVLEILDKGIKDWEFNKEEWEEQIRLACYLRPDSQMEAQQITDSAIKIIKNLLSKSLLSQRIETANKLKEICNKCRTERGLATAIGNFINQIKH